MTRYGSPTIGRLQATDNFSAKNNKNQLVTNLYNINLLTMTTHYFSLTTAYDA
jgi:hypothetical protein